MIRSLGFLGVRTDAFAATTALDRDVLDGNVYQIIGPEPVAS
jgi:hypothetical protein